MAFDPTQYVIAPSLQSYFVDKLTGEPLAGGQVYFYKDNKRTEFKDVFQLTGTYGSYSYVPLPNPIILSSVGTIQDDDGNDIIPYYYPFDDEGNVELYYVVVQAEDGTPQWTREAWPNTAGSNVPGANNESLNYIPNGQFLAHTNLVNDGLIPNTQAETIIAQGGWSFNRPADGGSAAIDTVTFEQVTQYTPNPSASPRYRVKLVAGHVSEDTYKDIRIKFRDVNKFASLTQNYQFSFWAEALQQINVGIYLIKNYGTGGTAETEQSIGTITIGTEGQQYNQEILFGVNTDITMGTENDDYLQIALRFPVGITFTVLLTDFVLEQGELPIIEFPQTPDSDFLSHGVAGWMPTPAYDGSDLYLPLVLTREGLTYDHAQIGRIYATVNSPASDSNELLCDGSAYVTSDYSDLKVPYSRLQAKLFDDTLKMPIYGTGADYLSSYLSTSDTSKVIVTTNQNSTGSISLPNDGVLPTGFTFSTFYSAINTDRQLKAYLQASDTLIVFGTQIGAANAVADPHTSGFTTPTLLNNANVKQSFTVQTVAASSLTNPGGAGKYFSFSNTSTDYYMWFHFTNETDPAPGGTGIRINLDEFSSATAAEVAQIVAAALNNEQVSTINCTGSSTIEAGSYFNVHTQDETYAVWFSINNSGLAPVTSAIKIKVELANSSVDAATVAEAVRTAMNSYQFAVPDFRGVFLRGTDDGAGNDPNADTRYGQIYTLFGDRIGTFESYQVQSHSHTYNNPSGGGGGTSGGGPISINSSNTGLTGGNETRPINANINYVIIY